MAILIKKLTLERLKEVLSYDPESGVFTWKVNSSKYKTGDIAGKMYGKDFLRIGIDKKAYCVNRLAWQYMTGEVPDSCINPKDGNKLNNKYSNLEKIIKAKTRIDMTGVRAGRLTVVSFAGNDSYKRTLWLCMCDCGASKTILGKYLRNGLTRSCGCLKKESMTKLFTTHGMVGTPTYATWTSMLARCYNSNQKSYSKYGAIGVTVCDRWRESFENFYSDMGERPKWKTLDRRNPFGNYEPNNCKWSTAKEQGMNKRGHVAIAMLEKLVSDGILSSHILAMTYNKIFSGDVRESYSPIKSFEDGRKLILEYDPIDIG